MSKPVIYGNCESGNCLKIQYILRILQIDHDWVEIDIFNGGARTEEFLRKNPAGQVPTAVLSDGRVLAESNAILMHFGRGSQFWPQDPYLESKMFQWLFWEQYSHERFIAVRRSLLRHQGAAEDQLDPELYARGRRALWLMDQQLLDTPYLVSDQPTLADIALYPYTKLAGEGGFDLEEFIEVMAWLARMERNLDLEINS